jgi:hypothetical protein
MPASALDAADGKDLNQASEVDVSAGESAEMTFPLERRV